MRFSKAIVLVAASTALAGMLPGVADAAKVTLKVAHAWPSVRLPNQLEFDKQFMKKHPNIIVKCENTDWGTFRDKMLGRFAAGSAPDIMYTLGGWAQMWAKKGLLRDLTPYIAQTKGFNLADFNIEGLRKYSRGGRYYALPYAWSPMPIYWNMTLFKQAGVEYPAYDSFDFDKLLEISKKLSRDTNGDGKNELIGLEPLNVPAWTGAGLFRPFGASLLAADEQTMTCDDPKAIQAVQWWADLGLKNKAATYTWGTFTAGKVAMTMSYGSWDIGAIHLAVKNKFEWDLGHWPKGPARRATVAESSGYGITQASKHPAEAWLYLNEYLSTQGQKFMKESFGADVSRRSAWALDIPPDGPKKITMKVIFDTIDDYAFDAPANPAMDYIYPIMGQEWAKITAGKSSVAQAMSNIKKQGDIILRTRKI